MGRHVPVGAGRWLVVVGYGQLFSLSSLFSWPPLSRPPVMQAAPPQAFPAANKGTLVPGQSITVNKYTVVVERYLSQGRPPSLLDRQSS